MHIRQCNLAARTARAIRRVRSLRFQTHFQTVFLPQSNLNNNLNPKPQTLKPTALKKKPIKTCSEAFDGDFLGPWEALGLEVHFGVLGEGSGFGFTGSRVWGGQV